MSTDLDIIRAAFSHVSYLELIYGSAIPDKALKEGFIFEGENISLRGPQGIFKAKQMQEVALSITTTIPREGRKPVYIDRETDDGFYQYSFEESDRDRNHYLYASYEKSTSFIYFKVVKHAVYQCIWPCFVESIDEKNRFFGVIVGRKPKLLGTIQISNFVKPDTIEARYYVSESKTRGHQAQFREMVLEAYRFKCAITGLPETRLLEAAHIVPDSDESSTQHVSNGIALNKLHHRAYDSNLIGIDPDYKIHISKALAKLKDGPLLDQGILSYDCKELLLPEDRNRWPNVDYLNRRFEKFLLLDK